MITKAECISILERLKTNSNTCTVNDQIDTAAIKSIISQSTDSEDAYIKIGSLLTIADSVFGNISFREDCYDYLIQHDFGENEAYNLMEIIRKGKYRFEKYQISSDKLSDDFYNWAKGVKYLPSRKVLMDMNESKTLYKETIVEEFDSYYYKKLKKSLPTKIKDGELEWIYAYGDKLISCGSKSVFEAVRKIVETKKCDNAYIDSDLLYAKCEELYAKYKNKKFWFCRF